MSEGYLTTLIGFSVPMFSTVICALLCFMYCLGVSNPVQRRLSGLTACTFMAAALCWLGLTLYFSNYEAFVYFNTPLFLMLMLDQVLLYNCIHIITDTGNHRKFNKFHYIIPLCVTAVIGIWSVSIPFEFRYQLIESRKIFDPAYPAFSVIFSMSTFVFLFYNIFYSILGFRRASKYRREVINYSADTERMSVSWIYAFIILVFLSMPIPVASIFVNRNTLLGSQLIIIGAVLPLIQYVIIGYNLISGNYVIIEPPAAEEQMPGGGNTKIDKKKFEKYMAEKKPYLNPRLKITNMCADMGTNRIYLSAFINNEYGVNFSRYVNRSRLAELDRIKSDLVHAGASSMDLILYAGFSSYRSYLRTKKTEHKSALLKAYD